MFPTTRLRTLFISTILLLSASFGLYAVPAEAPKADKPVRTSPVSKVEVRQLVDLLERYHYNHEKVRPSSYAQVIPEFMEDLDGQHLFFLSTDKVDFDKRHGSSLFYNLRDLGSTEVAFDIFAVYEKRINDRIAWIFEELKQDYDFTAKEFYRADRSKSDWPDSAAAADDLWRKRLKFELVAELMDKKTPEQAKEKVRKRYERMLKNIGEFENVDIAEFFLSSFTRLFDPHSTYFSADSYEDFGIQMKLKLVGIGAVLGIEDDICTIKEIIPGGPADLDKRLKPNDKILAVAQDGSETVDIIGMKLRKIVDQIRGEKGTKVHLTVQPADDTDGSARKEIVITRDMVKLNSARAHGAVFEIPGAQGTAPTPVGVITLPSFYGGDDPSDTSEEKTSCSKDVRELITRLKAENVKAIVLDMRRNGGGLLSEAVNISGLFINSGPIVQVRDSNGSIDVNSDDNSGVEYEGPLAVLVDRFSASASEIVAGALQDYGRAIVVGDTSTHGKGTVQTIIEMRRVIPSLMLGNTKTGAAKITIQKFYLPSGASTQVKGVVPDIILPSFEDYIPNIGEADLKNALVWDEIRTSFFDGKALPKNIVTSLKDQSLKRQASLTEFSFLNRSIEWFRTRQDQKMISLNLEDRLKQKESDEVYRKESKAERQQLEKESFVYHEVRLVPAPPPRVKAEKKPDDSTPIDDEDDGVEGYARLDVQLRETMRILTDALQFGKDPKSWIYPFAPLTAQATRQNALSK